MNTEKEEVIFNLLSRIDNKKIKYLLDEIDVKGGPEVSDLTMERTKVLLFKKMRVHQKDSNNEQKN